MKLVDADALKVRLTFSNNTNDILVKDMRKVFEAIDSMPSCGTPLEECEDCISRQAAIDAIWDGVNMDIYTREVKECLEQLPSVTPAEKLNKWIPVSERLPELNRPLLVTAYHRVYYGHLISESGDYGYPVFRIHGLGDKDRNWVQETMSHEPYSLGRIDAWIYLDIPEPYKASPTDEEVEE